MLNIAPGILKNWVENHVRDTTPWIFHHVPKTAGSSLTAEISDRIPSYVNVEGDYSGDGGTYRASMDAKVAKTAAAMGAPGGPAVVSGHFSAHHIADLRAQVPDVRIFTFLRDPVARVISEYNYSRSALHPPHAEFAARYPTIEDYVADPDEANKTALILFGSNDIPPDHAVHLMSQCYDMVGVQERYPVSFLLLSKLLWGASLPVAQERRAKPSAPPSVDLVTLIRRRNAADMALFNTAMGAYEKLAPEIWRLYKP